MKGIVFCEFLDMVDSKISPEMTEKLIDQCDLPSGGAYTSVGTYDHDEIITLVAALSKETGASVPELVKSFGQHLLTRFSVLYPDFFEQSSTVYEFLDTIDSKIHVDVRKLYPEAELPSINCRQISDREFELLYESGKAMGDLAEGLIASTIEYYGENISLNREDLSSGNAQCVRFTLRKND